MSELRIPFSDRSDRLVDVAAAAFHLDDPEERAVVRELVSQRHAAGARTAGDLLDQLDGADPAQRRAMVDRARKAAGLETLTAIEEHRRWEAAQPPPPTGPPRDEAGLAFMLCAEPRCGAQPLDPATGGPLKVAAKKWWCPAHEHLAGPGDLDPWTGARLVLGPAGIIDLDEQEREAVLEAERAERLRARREAARVEKQEAADWAARDKQARRDQHEREAADPILRAAR